MFCFLVQCCLWLCIYVSLVSKRTSHLMCPRDWTNHLHALFVCLEWTNCVMCSCVWSEPIVKCVCVFEVNQLWDVFVCLEWTNCEMCSCVWSEPIVKCVCVFGVNQLWDVFVCLEWTMMCPCVFNRTIIWGTCQSYISTVPSKLLWQITLGYFDLNDTKILYFQMFLQPWWSVIQLGLADRSKWWFN